METFDAAWLLDETIRLRVLMQRPYYGLGLFLTLCILIREREA